MPLTSSQPSSLLTFSPDSVSPPFFQMNPNPCQNRLFLQSAFTALPKPSIRFRCSLVQSHLFAFLLSLQLTCLSFGQIFDERFQDWPVEVKIGGKVLVAGETESSPLIARLLSEEERFRPTAILLGADVAANSVQELQQLFPRKKSLLQPQKEWNAALLENLLEDSPIVVLGNTKELTEAEVTAFSSVRNQFSDFIRGGGTLVALGPVSKILSAAFMAGSEDELHFQTGLALIPDVILETNYDDRGNRESLLATLAERPRSVGIGLAERTALILSGRKIRVAGSGQATFLVAGNKTKKPRVQALREFQGRTRNMESVLLDLTQWRREAIDRTLAPFPTSEPRPPIVENGTLIIVGGGGTPRGLTRKMVELAGGLQEARLVYIPCSENDTVGTMQRTVENWKRMGVKHATYIHNKDRNKANTDEEFLKPLKEATGLYFGGGRQWNFSDSYYGTKAHELMKDVLKRGGVIMGSSAGASIQGRYLARATPIGNHKIIAFGYERGGLGFLDGVAIDQHFTQRNRFGDLTHLKKQYPQLLGIGIDESTAIVVQKSSAQVVGRGRVFFYDRKSAEDSDQPDYTALSEGAVYDLVQRAIIKKEE